jgi:L-aspartate oxidase
MRGEGGVLRNQVGQRFMQRYNEAAELAPRDIVSRSIVAELENTHTDVALLDMRHLDRDFIIERFPKIYSTCLHYGLDITKEAIPVSPAAHYMMGGVRTDVDGRTDLRGLYAAGEVACAGVHGANRLASNSLLEGLVFGARAGAAARNEATPAKPDVEPHDEQTTDWHIDSAIRNNVRELMWTNAGIVRDSKGLQEAITKLNEISKSGENRINVATKNFIIVATLIVSSALKRTESRGGHFRSDYPTTDDEHWRRHSLQNISAHYSTEPVGQL